MKLVAKLNVPYTEQQRVDFIIEYNRGQGCEIRYTMEAVEAWGKTEDEIIEDTKVAMRNIRNEYLVTYVDPKQLVLVWDSLSEEDKQSYTGYRQYLLNYPQSSSTWYEQEPLTYGEWKC